MELIDSLNAIGYSFEELREDLEANDELATESARFATMFQSLLDVPGMDEAKARQAVQYGIENRLGESVSLEGLAGNAWEFVKQLVQKILKFLYELGQRVFEYVRQRKNERQSLKSSAALIRTAYGSKKVGESDLRNKMLGLLTQADSHLVHNGYLSSNLSLLDAEFNQIIDDAFKVADSMTRMLAGNKAAEVDFKGYTLKIAATQAAALKLITKSKQFSGAGSLKESIEKTRENLINLSLKTLPRPDALGVEKYFAKISQRDFEKLYSRTRESVGRVKDLTQQIGELSDQLRRQPDPEVIAKLNNGVAFLNSLSSVIWSYCALEFFVYERLRNTVAMMGMVSKQFLK